MTKEQIIIIALIVVIIYLAYQQENNQSPLIVESPNTQKLRAELNHYQKLYENRVKKDLGLENKDAETQTSLTNEQVDKLTSQWKQVSQWAQEIGIDINQKWNLSLLKDKVNDLSHQQQQEQLRKINLLFDDQAQDYSFIDFNGLYSLLSSIAEREREREQNSDGYQTAEE